MGNEEISKVIFKIVEGITRIPKANFVSANRRRENVLARCLYINLMSIYSNLTESAIANKTKRERTTVIYMQNLHSDLMCVDKVYQQMFFDCSDQYIRMTIKDRTLSVDAMKIAEKLDALEKEIHVLRNVLNNFKTTKTRVLNESTTITD